MPPRMTTASTLTTSTPSSTANPAKPADVQAFFNQSWQIYQKLLCYNYMGHQQIYTLLHDLWRNRFRGNFSLLDLGCGDAWYAAQALQGTLIEHYHGVDLSEVALAIAAENLAGLRGKQTFSQSDLLQFVRTCPDKFDLILTSFALHHLSLAEKAEFLSRIPHLLNPGGRLLLVDVCRRSGEDRASYIQRYTQQMQRDWTEMSRAELEILSDHIASSDLPESVEIWTDLAYRYGFPRVECLYSHSDQASKLLCFYRG